MAVPGRNDPCPCGSGKKFKHCHLERAQPATGITPEDRDAAFDALSRYATRDEFQEAVDLGILVWMGRAPDGDVDEAFADIDEHATSYHAFWDWMFFDAPLPTGGTIASAFLERRSRSLHPRGEDYLRLMSGTHVRLYQVREARPGEGLLVRDLWTDDDLFIADASRSRQMVVWDVLAGRVNTLADGTRQLEGTSLVLPPNAAPPIVTSLQTEYRRLQRSAQDLTVEAFCKMVAPVLHQEWYDRVAMAPLPDMRTAEGDPLTASTLEFDVPRSNEALLTLTGAPDFVSSDIGDAIWIDPEAGQLRLLGELYADHRTLTLQTVSRERAARGRARMEELLGPLRLVREEHRAPGAAVGADVGGLDDELDEAADIGVNDVPEVTAFLGQKDHEWLDLELPALDGATPRMAARDPHLQPRLVALLMRIENRQARMALRGQGREASWMWDELGLPRP